MMPDWSITAARWLAVVSFTMFVAGQSANGITATELWVQTVVGIFIAVFVLVADWVMNGPAQIPGDNVVIGCMHCGAPHRNGRRTCGPDCPRGADLR